MNWDCHLLSEGGKRCEHEQSKWMGISLTRWWWKEVWAWVITVNWDWNLLSEGGMRSKHEQSQWIRIVTYFLRVEWGLSMSNHSELGLSLTSWGWKEVWAWAITVNGDCHLLPGGGMRCEHEQSHWIGIVTYLLRWKEVWAWAITVNCDHHLLSEGRKRCGHEQLQWIRIVTHFLRVESGVSTSNHIELRLSLTHWEWNEVWA